jgi:hypothetical protein
VSLIAGGGKSQAERESLTRDRLVPPDTAGPLGERQRAEIELAVQQTAQRFGQPTDVDLENRKVLRRELYIFAIEFGIAANRDDATFPAANTPRAMLPGRARAGDS